MPPVRAHIVYVEDNQSDVLLLDQAMEERGFAGKLQVLPNYDDALHYFQIKATTTDVPPPDLILLDYRLPMGDGAALLQFIQTNAALHVVPTFLFASEQFARHLGIDPTICLQKAIDWGGMLQIADRLIHAIRTKPTSKQ